MEYLAIGVWLFLSIIVTIYLVRRDDLEKEQVIGQAIIVWLIPLLGAVGIWLFNRSHDDSFKRSKNSDRSSGTSGIHNDGVGGGSD